MEQPCRVYVKHASLIGESFTRLILLGSEAMLYKQRNLMMSYIGLPRNLLLPQISIKRCYHE